MCCTNEHNGTVGIKSITLLTCEDFVLNNGAKGQTPVWLMQRYRLCGPFEHRNLYVSSILECGIQFYYVARIWHISV